MPDLKSIPDDTKWQLAAKLAALLPALYERAYRDVVGEKYDEIEQEIWMGLSSMVSTIVRDLSLPARTASEIAECIRIVLTIWFGPDYKSETLEVSKDGTVVLIRRCPFLDTSHTFACEVCSGTFQKCMALILTTVPLLNKNYAARFVRTMCTGDRQCEIKIFEVKKALTDEGKKK
jgi:hypothetical protein